MGRNNRIEKKIDKLLKLPEVKFPKDDDASDCTLPKYNLPSAMDLMVDDLEYCIVPFIHNMNVRVGLTPSNLSEEEVSNIIKISDRYNDTLTEHGFEKVSPVMFTFVYCSFIIVALKMAQGNTPDSKIGPAESIQLEIDAQRILQTISFRLITSSSAKHKFFRAFDHILRSCDRQNVFQKCIKAIMELLDDISKEYGY